MPVHLPTPLPMTCSNVRRQPSPLALSHRHIEISSHAFRQKWGTLNWVKIMEGLNPVPYQWLREFPTFSHSFCLCLFLPSQQGREKQRVSLFNRQALLRFPLVPVGLSGVIQGEDVFLSVTRPHPSHSKLKNSDHTEPVMTICLHEKVCVHTHTRIHTRAHIHMNTGGEMAGWRFPPGAQQRLDEVSSKETLP